MRFALGWPSGSFGETGTGAFVSGSAGRSVGQQSFKPATGPEAIERLLSAVQLTIDATTVE
jgi:hypothetical protein